MKMKQFETKLFHFHRKFKTRGGGRWGTGREAVQVTPQTPFGSATVVQSISDISRQEQTTSRDWQAKFIFQKNSETTLTHTNVPHKLHKIIDNFHQKNI